MKGQYCSSAENSMKVLPGWKVNPPVGYHRIWWYITDDVFDHFNCIWVREFERSNFHIIILNYYLIFLLNLFLYYIVCQRKMICVDIHLLNVECSQLLFAPSDYQRCCLQFMKLLKLKAVCFQFSIWGCTGIQWCFLFKSDVSKLSMCIAFLNRINPE